MGGGGCTIHLSVFIYVQIYVGFKRNKSPMMADDEARRDSQTLMISWFFYFFFLFSLYLLSIAHFLSHSITSLSRIFYSLYVYVRALPLCTNINILKENARIFLTAAKGRRERTQFIGGTDRYVSFEPANR